MSIKIKIKLIKEEAHHVEFLPQTTDFYRLVMLI